MLAMEARHRPARGGWTSHWLARIALLFTSTLVCLGLLELVLRAYPLLLGDTYTNGALSKYTTRPGGIYYKDHALGINFMIPQLTTTMYCNRYVWTHEADAFGFRNRDPAVPADVVLLGDSLVYGHGVEYGDTVGYLLRQRTGLTVVNLARQGDSAFQQAYLLTEYLPVFRPRWILYHFYENDIPDLRAYLSEGEMRAFIATPVAAITFPPRTPVAEALVAREQAFRRRSWLGRVWDSSYVGKAYRWARQVLRVGVVHAETRRLRHEGDEEDSLGWRYTEHAIRYMQHIAAVRARRSRSCRSHRARPATARSSLGSRPTSGCQLSTLGTSPPPMPRCGVRGTATSPPAGPAAWRRSKQSLFGGLGVAALRARAPRKPVPRARLAGQGDRAP